MRAMDAVILDNQPSVILNPAVNINSVYVINTLQSISGKDEYTYPVSKLLFNFQWRSQKFIESGSAEPWSGLDRTGQGWMD